MTTAYDFYDDDYDDGSCPNCGGEGYVYDCIDGCCFNAEEGCDLCAYRCDWCNAPPPLTGHPVTLKETR